MLYKVILPFESVGEIVNVTIQMKATEQYFPVVLFIMMYKVVTTFVLTDERYRIVPRQSTVRLFTWVRLAG